MTGTSKGDVYRSCTKLDDMAAALMDSDEPKTLGLERRLGSRAFIIITALLPSSRLTLPSTLRESHSPYKTRSQRLLRLPQTLARASSTNSHCHACVWPPRSTYRVQQEGRNDQGGVRHAQKIDSQHFIALGGAQEQHADVKERAVKHLAQCDTKVHRRGDFAGSSQVANESALPLTPRAPR